MPHILLSLSGKCCFCFLLFIYTIRSKAVVVEHSFPNRYREHGLKIHLDRAFYKEKLRLAIMIEKMEYVGPFQFNIYYQ